MTNLLDRTVSEILVLLVKDMLSKSKSLKI